MGLFWPIAVLNRRGLGRGHGSPLSGITENNRGSSFPAENRKVLVTTVNAKCLN